MELYYNMQQDPYLQDRSTTIQQHILLEIAAWNRWGYCSRGHQVGAQTPETALGHVAQTISLAGYANPRHSYSSTDIYLPFSCFLNSYKTNDPSSKHQFALPIQTIQCVADFYRSKQTLVASAVADPLTTAFFFLFCPWEYTMTVSCSKTRIVQFWRQDVRFFQNGTVLPQKITLAEIQEADGVRLYLDNRNNGQHGSTMYHSALNHAFCPVKALANWTHYLYSIAPEVERISISYIGNIHHITTADITLSVQ